MTDDIYDDQWPVREPGEESTGSDRMEDPAEGKTPVEPPMEEPPAPVEPPMHTGGAFIPAEPDRFSSVTEGWGSVEEPPAVDGPPPANERPFEEERAFVGGDDAVLDAITADLSDGENAEAAAERSRTSHVGEDVIILGAAGSTAESPAIVAVDGTVLAAPDAMAAPAAVDMGPERRGNVWIWVGAIIGVLLMAGALGYAWWYMNERPIPVPNVVGRLPAQAAQALNDAGLRLGKVTEVPTDTAPVGTVIEQSPEAKKELKPGTAVSIVLAGSPEMSKVPDVVGAASVEAVRTLASARLSAHVVESYNSTVAAGFVHSQVPSSTAEVEPGSVVALLVSKGPHPASYRVPKLVGLPEADANALLSTLEVRAEVFRSFNSSVPAGQVMEQSPSPDAQVPFDGVVQYLVSKGPGSSSVTVPDLIRTASASAIGRLKNLGLKAKVVFQASPEVTKGQIISQMPPARARTSPGETVGLVVSSTETTVPTVPQVTRKTADEAGKQLSSLGYSVARVEVRTNTVPGGQVYLQLPAPGTQWTLRYPVVLLVAAP